YPMFVPPAQALGVDPVGVGGLVSLGAAAGRTMSPVAVVALMAATLTDTNAFALARRVAPPGLVGLCLSSALAAGRLRGRRAGWSSVSPGRYTAAARPTSKEARHADRPVRGRRRRAARPAHRHLRRLRPALRPQLAGRQAVPALRLRPGRPARPARAGRPGPP